MAKFFKHDFTSDRVREWGDHLDHLKGLQINGMEIGTHEGRTACWMLDNILTHPKAHLYCIDPYTYLERMEVKNLTVLQKRAEHNLSGYNNVTRILNASQHALPVLHRQLKEPIHLAYIDGQHTYNATLADMLSVWVLLAPHDRAIMIVDDIIANDSRQRQWGEDCPRVALQTFKRLELPYKILWEGKTVGIEKL